MDFPRYSTGDDDDSPDWVHIPMRVGDAQDGYRLDRFLCTRVGRLSRRRVQQIIAAGNVQRAGQRTPMVRASMRVRAGEVLVLRRPARDEPAVVRNFEVLYQDDELLVVDKAAGLPVHPSARYHRNTLTAVMRERLGDGHPWVMAHRLDRETSGVMVFARRGSASASIKNAFARRNVEKRYLALCHGELTSARTLDRPLGLGGSRIRIKMGPVDLVDGGLASVTHVDPLAAGRFGDQPVTLVRARPRTGRQHQIRAHLALAGYPVVGDKMYGVSEDWFIDMVEGRCTMAELERMVGLSRHALHAHRITLGHPRTGELVTFTAPWPTQLAQIVPHE